MLGLWIHGTQEQILIQATCVRVCKMEDGSWSVIASNGERSWVIAKYKASAEEEVKEAIMNFVLFIERQNGRKVFRIHGNI